MTPGRTSPDYEQLAFWSANPYRRIEPVYRFDEGWLEERGHGGWDYAGKRALSLRWARGEDLGASRPSALSVKRMDGAKWSVLTEQDCLWSVYSAPHVVSTRVRSLVESEGLTGVTFAEVVVNGLTGLFSAAIVTGRCAPLDVLRSEVVHPPRGRTRLRGHYFEGDRSDRSDFMMEATGPSGGVVVSSRARRALVEAGCPGDGFLPLTQIQYLPSVEERSRHPGLRD